MCNSNLDCVSYYQELLDSGYRPPAPEQVTTVPGPGAVSLTWSHVHCAELYDVTYTSVTDNRPWSVQVSVGLYYITIEY